jgi:hypothetical protein
VGAAKVFCGQSKAGGVSSRWTSLGFRSSKGTALWPEEELEDLVCDVAANSTVLICN